MSALLQPGPDERKSELLPAGWEANKEVYTLRYKSTDDARELLLKAIMVEDSMILNVMVSTHRVPVAWDPSGAVAAATQNRAHFLNFCCCLFCLAVVFVPQDGADPGDVWGCRSACAAADVKLVKHQLHWGSDVVCIACSGYGVAPFVSPSQLRIFLQMFSSVPHKHVPRVFSLSPLAAPIWGASRESLALHWSLCASGDSGTAQGGDRKQASPFLMSKPLAVVIPAPSLIPCSAPLLTPYFTCLFPGSQFSEGGRCDLVSGRLHQPGAPGRFPQVISVPQHFLQEKMSQQRGEGGRDHVRTSLEDSPPQYKPQGQSSQP